jgi:hypothetical protein
MATIGGGEIRCGTAGKRALAAAGPPAVSSKLAALAELAVLGSGPVGALVPGGVVPPPDD